MICIQFLKDHSACWVEMGMGEGRQAGVRAETGRQGWRLAGALVRDDGGSD